MAISQPRIKAAPSESDLSVDELEAWGRSTARSAVASCRNASSTYADASDGATTPWFDAFLRPGEKQCKFCRAKATCPALRAEVFDAALGAVPATPDEFADIEPATSEHMKDSDPAWLAACLSKVDLIEDWCKAIRAETERRLLAGDDVPGFKLVQGKRGARQWADAKAAEETLKAMRLKESEMYDFKLISPTTADKLAKAGTIGPKQWTKVQALIVQKEGAPHVAPVSDSRPALVVTPVADDFENLA
jgi:hypothetical protein